MSFNKLFTSRRLWVLLLLIGFSPALNGCFIKSMAVNSVADGLAGQGDTFSSDNDPQLIKEAVPFSLKFMESILAATPRHTELLGALCKNFTEYTYAYVQCEADYIADSNYTQARELRVRAKKLYQRAYEYGLRGLETRHDHFAQMIMTDPKAAVSKLNKDDADLMYWTGVAWMAAISIGKDDPELVSDVPQAEALIYKAEELVPDYDNGSLQEFLITYESGKPTLMGGDMKRVKKHYDKALELTKGMSAATYVNYAEGYDLKQQNREEFEENLNKALDIDVDQVKSLRLVNLIEQKRARWLLSRADTLFVK
ncbi:MAG TPA: TRAP transporter TatT component family protein [bacterium]|jgi:tetratricopeptide (TPR) repeat protein|nr:TRAP transporter TatT component family protein [bacterium]